MVDGREKFSTLAWDPLYIGNLSGSAVITNIKSSNKHFTARKGEGVNAIYVEEKPDYVIKDGIKTTISFKTEKTSLNSDKTLYPLVISAYLCTPISPE